MKNHQLSQVWYHHHKYQYLGNANITLWRGAVKRVEHISTIVLVNICVARVRVPLVLSVGIWICKNSIINT